MSTSTHLLSANPFNYQIANDPKAFHGRQEELRAICDYLRGDSSRCCAIIGESYIGKTSLLRYLTHPQGATTREDLGIENVIFVYFNTGPYIDKAGDEHASVQFWSDLLSAFQSRVNANHSSRQYPLKSGGGRNPIDKAFEIKCNVEKLIQEQRESVIFALDNFQGIAHLPLADSDWLRAMANDHNCAYVVTSRHLLYLLYHADSWERPSPLWNLFTDRVYLGLLQENEAMELILQKEKLANFWYEEDIEFIKKTAGRHPELLRMTCALLYEKRQQAGGALNPEEYESLESRLYRDASPICNQLWYGLADPELMGVSRSAAYRRDPAKLSMHQRVLMDVAREGDSKEDHQYLFDLKDRGLIERAGEKWQVFAGLMYQFMVRQQQVREMAGLAPDNPTTNPTSTETMPPPAFTYLEGRVYQYLQAHAGEVCHKDEIKRAIWKDTLPSDSTLQKIIERIRRKIEPEPDNPRYLIAVRGQGYILREGQAE